MIFEAEVTIVIAEYHSKEYFQFIFFDLCLFISEIYEHFKTKAGNILVLKDYQKK